jgi:hypothetical protein
MYVCVTWASTSAHSFSNSVFWAERMPSRRLLKGALPATDKHQPTADDMTHEQQECAAYRSISGAPPSAPTRPHELDLKAGRPGGHIARHDTKRLFNSVDRNKSSPLLPFRTGPIAAKMSFIGKVLRIQARISHTRP